MKVKTQFNLSLSPDELTTIKNLALKAGKSVNRYVIDSALKVAKPVERITEVETVKPAQSIEKPKKVEKQAIKPVKTKIEAKPIEKPWTGGYSKQDSAKAKA
jgi:uncharacterized protein (DUF1778 family)